MAGTGGQHHRNIQSLVSKLGEDFAFSRVDLYEVGNKIFFGEITIHPGGGGEPFDSKKADLEFGQFINLDS